MQCLLEGKKNKIILEAMHFWGGAVVLALLTKKTENKTQHLQIATS